MTGGASSIHRVYDVVNKAFHYGDGGGGGDTTGIIVDGEVV